jgi:5-methylcytosine-specific restriction protein A
VRPHLLITASDDAISGIDDAAPAEILGVGAIPAATLQRLACDADATDIAASSAGEPLDLGRARRTAPPQMRRALVKRFQGCSWPGCDRPPAWTEAHHIQPWSKGGRTKVDNLVTLCRVHHRYVHEEGWKLTVTGDKVEARPP